MTQENQTELENTLAEIVEDAGFEVTGKSMPKLGFPSYPVPIYRSEILDRCSVSDFARIYHARDTDSGLSLSVAAIVPERLVHPYYLLVAGFNRQYPFPVVNDFDPALRIRGRFFSPLQRDSLTYGEKTSEITQNAKIAANGRNRVGYVVVLAENEERAVNYCKKISEAAKTAEERSQKGE
jgi:hypothetical protein